MRVLLFLGAIGALLIAGPAARAYEEAPMLAAKVAAGELPGIAERLPETPLTLAAKTPGRYGGSLRTLIGKAKEIRYAVVWGYARLARYGPDLTISPDIAEAIEVSEGGRVYTIRLRKGHRWSDGAPFTAEDFRYFWEDVAQNPELSPAGPPSALLVDGKSPNFEMLDAQTIRYTWDAPNAAFLDRLAAARPPFLYRPAHYMKPFHGKYAEGEALAARVAEERVASWAALHNRYDNMYKNDNPALPSLQPWVNTTRPPAARFTLVRNPYFHRVDQKGRQLPYIDEVIMNVADRRLTPAKATAGETDLQARGLTFRDIGVLKQAEARGGYATRLWPIAKAAQVALYPNLTVKDKGWRALLRDGRVRRALSLGIDRAAINQSLYLGLATPGNVTALPQSPLHDPALLALHAAYDPGTANALLDEAGLSARDGDGTRLLPDGRRAEIIVETAGESLEEVDVLELIRETWAGIGIKLFIKPSERTVMRNRAYAGEAVMTVWSGWDVGLPTADIPPTELAPVRQEGLYWPRWGQYYETRGKAGEPVDMAPAEELMALYGAWEKAGDGEARAAAWKRMLEIHAEQQFVIGVVSGVRQPVVVNAKLRNVPKEGFYSWHPGAQFGVYSPDQFWFEGP